MKINMNRPTLAELVPALAPWARRGHRERLAIAYRQRAALVGLHICVDPRALLSDERARFRLLGERGL